jgi:hypothetical protein
VAAARALGFHEVAVGPCGFCRHEFGRSSAQPGRPATSASSEVDTRTSAFATALGAIKAVVAQATKMPPSGALPKTTIRLPLGFARCEATPGEAQ